MAFLKNSEKKEYVHIKKIVDQKSLVLLKSKKKLGSIDSLMEKIGQLSQVTFIF